ncbi:hypothetical protein AB0N05_37760 [Nocardia sp. NPDC051030]|uniref:hypothetical protein n=1 Tax=Nocardia sp. NPDC051030 TaxID=3155162 RepID=UPI003418D596
MTAMTDDTRLVPSQRITGAAAVLPSAHEVVCAVWGTSVEASGGPDAREILVHLHDLAELYAAQIHAEEHQLPRPEAYEFASGRDYLTGRIDSILLTRLSDLAENDRQDLVTLYEELAAMAARTQRACRKHLGTADPAVHEQWTRLAELRDLYADRVTTLVSVPPWLADVIEGPW